MYAEKHRVGRDRRRASSVAEGGDFNDTASSAFDLNRPAQSCRAMMLALAPAFRRASRRVAGTNDFTAHAVGEIDRAHINVRFKGSCTRRAYSRRPLGTSRQRPTNNQVLTRDIRFAEIGTPPADGECDTKLRRPRSAFRVQRIRTGRGRSWPRHAAQRHLLDGPAREVDWAA